MMIQGAKGVEPGRQSGTTMSKGRVPNGHINAAGRHPQRRNRHLPLWWQLLNLAFRNVS